MYDMNVYLIFYQQLILQQHAQQGQPIQCIAPPPPPSSTAVTPTCNNANALGEVRSVPGKAQGGKRNGSNKQRQNSKNSSQSLEKPPPLSAPPPPPPPPPQCNLHPAKGTRLLPQQQQILNQAAQPIVFQTEHNGGLFGHNITAILAVLVSVVS